MNFLSLFGLVFGTGLSAIGIHILRVGAASRHWPRVSGTVRRVFIETMTQPGRLDQYSAKLEYEYEFEGTRQSVSLPIGMSYPLRANAEARVSQYVAGQKVDVFVNPLRPQNSTLHSGIDYSAITPVLIGVPAIVLSLWNLFAR